MVIEYFYWQYVIAPRWLALFLWHVQEAIAQFFSVKLMLRTLFAHWHRDALGYGGRPLGDSVHIFLLNQVSRLVGFCIRVTMIALWIIVEMVYLVFATLLYLTFLATPVLVIVGIYTAIILLLSY